MIFSEVTKPLSFHSPLRGLTSLSPKQLRQPGYWQGLYLYSGYLPSSNAATGPNPRQVPSVPTHILSSCWWCQVSDHSLGWEPAAAGEQGIRLSSFKVPLSGLPVELAGKLSSPQFCSTPFLFPRGSHSSPTLQTQFVKKVHIGSQSNTPRRLSTSLGNFRY